MSLDLLASLASGTLKAMDPRTKLLGEFVERQTLRASAPSRCHHNREVPDLRPSPRDNDNDNDTLREVPHPSNEGLAL